MVTSPNSKYSLLQQHTPLDIWQIYIACLDLSLLPQNKNLLFGSTLPQKEMDTSPINQIMSYNDPCITRNCPLQCCDAARTGCPTNFAACAYFYNNANNVNNYSTGLLSEGAKVGIGVGVAILVILIVTLVAVIYCKRQIQPTSSPEVAIPPSQMNIGMDMRVPPQYPMYLVQAPMVRPQGPMIMDNTNMGMAAPPDYGRGVRFDSNQYEYVYVSMDGMVQPVTNTVQNRRMESQISGQYANNF